MIDKSQVFNNQIQNFFTIHSKKNSNCDILTQDHFILWYFFI